jgi:hypothetical protein
MVVLLLMIYELIEFWSQFKKKNHVYLERDYLK